MAVHVADNVAPLQALTEDDPLHIILDELGPPGKQLSYSMNATICLTLTNRWDHSKGMAICESLWWSGSTLHPCMLYVCIQSGRSNSRFFLIEYFSHARLV